jgi:hypothetical protein
MGSLTHTEPAAEWRGKRVELTAELKAGRIGGWAGLWVRIDGADGKPLAFDNMQDRALQGTTAFAWHSVVLDVPQEAEHLSFGVLLHGPGAVLIRQLHFRVVPVGGQSTDLLSRIQSRPLTTP